ncbi:MAG: flagellar motor switch protein FliG [Acidobacteriota bacterium]
MVASTSGARKAAILSLLIGQESTATYFQHLGEQEVAAITKELARLQAVPPETGEGVLEEFHAMWADPLRSARGGTQFVKQVLARSLSPDIAHRVQERVKLGDSKPVFAVFDDADPQHLSKFILTEHPQTIALILANIKPAQAAKVVAWLPEALRIDVLKRMASVEDISPDVLGRISSVLEKRLKMLGVETHESAGGARAVAELLNHLDRSLSQSVLGGIEGDEPELAVSIRNLMFVFDDLLSIEDSALREIAQQVDKKVLTLALKGASEEIRAKFFKNMSSRAAGLIREDMDMLGAVRLRDVEQAQQEIVSMVRRLEEQGLLTTGAAGGEAYVV